MRTGNDVEITYTTEKFLSGFMVQDPDTGMYSIHGTSPWTDRIKTSTTIKVSLDELLQAGLDGRVPNFEFLRPANARLQVESYTGIVNASINTDVPKIYRLQDAISAGEDLPGRWDQFDQAMRSRIGGQQVVRFTNNGTPIAECLYECATSLTLKIGDGAPEPVPEEEKDTGA
jgi:hypothetical protein